MAAAGDNPEDLLFGDDSAGEVVKKNKKAPPALPPMPKKVKLDEDGEEEEMAVKKEEDIKGEEGGGSNSNNNSNNNVEKDPDEESLSSLSDSCKLFVLCVFPFICSFLISVVIADVDALEPTDNLIMCQFDSVKNTKAKWKVKLRSGMATLNGKEYCFSACNGDLKRWEIKILLRESDYVSV
jgi:hypothetical protein